MASHRASRLDSWTLARTTTTAYTVGVPKAPIQPWAAGAPGRMTGRIGPARRVPARTIARPAQRATTERRLTADLSRRPGIAGLCLSARSRSACRERTSCSSTHGFIAISQYYDSQRSTATNFRDIVVHLCPSSSMGPPALFHESSSAAPSPPSSTGLWPQPGGRSPGATMPHWPRRTKSSLTWANACAPSGTAVRPPAAGGRWRS